MATPDPPVSHNDSDQLRDYRKGRLSGEAERAFEERLLTEPGLAEELLRDEQLEVVTQSWSEQAGSSSKEARATAHPGRRVALAAAAGFAFGVVLAGGTAFFVFQDSRAVPGGSARIVGFDLLRNAAQEIAVRTVRVEPGLDFLVVELPTRAPEGEVVRVSLRHGDDEPISLVGRAHDGFTSIVIPTDAVPEDTYSISSAHAGDPAFELILTRK